jgi:radical S-adenosyl methionine domain-containing protein 2
LYCYRHIGKGQISFDDTKKIIKHLKNNGFNKLSFAGGEPLLLPWIFKAIKFAKEQDLVTELITNGSLLTRQMIQENARYLNVLTIDVDSLDNFASSALGKNNGHLARTKQLFNEAFTNHIQCKVNTVVTELNKNDIMEVCDWIKAQPGIYRWKLFQFLPSTGYAKINCTKLKILDEEFDYIGKTIKEKLYDWNGQLQIENNRFMSNGYASIDQVGNFYTAYKTTDGYETKILGKVLDMDANDLMNSPYINCELFLERSNNNTIYFKKLGVI